MMMHVRLYERSGIETSEKYLLPHEARCQELEFNHYNYKYWQLSCLTYLGYEQEAGTLLAGKKREA